MDTLHTPCHQLALQLQARNWQLATAESCTGGSLGALLTEQPGASNWYWGGWIVYSNAAKHNMLNVPTALINTHGAVSAEVAEAMASGALRNSSADASIAITGIAGPGGGTPEKPVGTVYVSWQFREQLPISQRCQFEGDRQAVRQASIRRAIMILNDLLSS